MQNLPTQQESPATLRSFHAVVCDAGLTPVARTLFAMIAIPIAQHKAIEIARAEIVPQLGRSLRETSRALAELEHAGLIASKLRGRGKPKLFVFGPNFDQRSLRFSGDSPVISSHTRTIGADRGEETWPPAATQEVLPFNAGSASENMRAISSSHAIVRGELDLHSVSATRNDDETTRARAHASERCTHKWLGSSSSLEIKLAEWGVSESTICRLLKDFPPGEYCKCIQCHGEPCSRIERQLERMPARIDHASRRGVPIASPDGHLVSAIAADYGWPKGAQPKQWQVDHAEAQLRAIDAPPAKSADEPRREAELSREKAIAYLRNLPAPEREAIERSAEDLARSFPKTFVGRNPRDEILLGKIHKHALTHGVAL